MSSPSAPSTRSLSSTQFWRTTAHQRLRVAGLLVSGSAVLPLLGVAASASAASGDATVYTHLAFSSTANQASFWENRYGPGLTCAKDESGSLGSAVTLTRGYAYVIVKSAAGNVGENANTVFKDPTSGQVVFADTNGNNVADAGGQDGDKVISHTIYCTATSVPSSTTSSSSTVPSTSTTSSSSTVPSTRTTSSSSTVPSTTTTDTSAVLPTSGSITSTTASPTVRGVKVTSTTSSTTGTAAAGTTGSTSAPSTSETVEGVKVSAGRTVSGGALPRTGSDVAPLLGLSAMLLLGGAALLRLSGVRLQRTGRH